MGWDPTNKSADAIISSSGDANAVANDQFSENGPFSGDWANAVSSFTLSGKVYFEYVSYNDGSATVESPVAGIVNEAWDETLQTLGVGRDGVGEDSWGLNPTQSNPKVRSYFDNTFTDLTGTLGTDPVHGDIWQIAFDTATGKLWFGRNNTWVGDPGAGTGETYTVTGTTFRLGASLFDSLGNGIKGFFNPASQTYSPPTGFSAPEANPPVQLAPASLEQAQEETQPTIFGFPTILSPVGLEQLQEETQPTLDTSDLVSPANLEQAQEETQPTLSYSALITPAALEHAQELVEPVLTISAIPYSGTWELLGLDAVPGTLINGAGFAGVFELPPLEADLYTGYDGIWELPVVTASGSLLVGRIFTGELVFPALVGTGTWSGSQTLSGTLQFPALDASGTLLNGLEFTGALVLPGLTAEGQLLRTVSLSGTLVLPALDTRDSVLLTGGFFSGIVVLPALELEGLFDNATTLTFFGLSTNAFNRAHGKYVGTEYVGLGRLGAQVYAAMDNGLYRLEGEDDDGVAIEAEFVLGFEDFGVEAVKAQRVAYIGLSANGPLELLVRTDTDGQKFYTYRLETPHETAAGEKPARVKLGRGLRGRYWQLGIRNIDGGDFQIDRLGLGVWNSTRKR